MALRLHKLKTLSLIILLACAAQVTVAQVGGQKSFEFLNLPLGTRQTALGGINISSYHNDVSMFMANPALLTDSTDLDLSLGYYNYYAGVQQSALAMSNSFKKLGTWAFGIQYINYGDFEGYDNTGNFTGDFKAAEYSLMISNAQQVANFRLGGTLKLANSSIEAYQATALLLDFGGIFIHPTKDFTVGMVFKNIGFQLSSYIEGQNFEMPLDIQIGATFKPDKMPIRLSVTAHHLQQFDIAYQNSADASQVDIFGQVIEEKISFADKLTRHFVIGGEFVMSKNLNFRVGYNFLQRRELTIENRRGLSGFSLGVMARFKKFEIAYANSVRHIVGGTNNISLTIHTSQFVNRKKKIIE